MADQKISQLTALTSLSTDDIFPVVDDPSGTPTTKKVATSVIDARMPGVTVGASGQYSTINAAVSALGAAGGKIFLQPGEYAPCTLASNIWLIGDNNGKSIIKIANSSQANGVLISGCSNVRVSNIRVNGNKTNVDNTGTAYTTINGIYISTSSTDITVDNCYLYDCYFGGIATDSSTNIKIINNRCTTNRDNGIFVRPGNINVLIQGNIVDSSSYSGIQALHSDYVNIVGNIAYSNGPTSAEGDGIGFEGCRYSSIVGNTIYSNGVQGIKVDYTVEGVDTQRSLDCIISDNVIYNHTDTGNGCGIEVLRSDNTLIQGNRIKTCKYGINIGEVVGITVKDNLITGTTSQGIRCHDTSTTGLVVIDGNIVTGAGSHGIEVFQNNVQITNNIVGGGSDQGIRISDGNNDYIAFNTCYDNANNGILISSSAGAVNIRYNYFYNTGSAQDRGIYEESTGGPSRLVGNIFAGMGTENYQLNTTGSIALDDEITALKDGVTAPGTVSGNARIYVDTADGDLKVKFGDGTVKTIIVDT